MYPITSHSIVRLMCPLMVLAAPATVSAVGIAAQRIVACRSAAMLPPELRTFFDSRRDDLEERTLEPETAWQDEGDLRTRRGWHYLRLDAASQNGSTSARLAAAESFPRKETEAKKLFKDLGLGKDGGRLLWAMEDLYGELVKAFRQGEPDEIIELAGYLTHFAWDASQPFCATVNHDGRQTGNLHLGESKISDPHYAHQSVQHRVMGELVRRNRNRYLDAVQVRPMDLKPAADPAEAVFRQMVSALARLEDLLDADRDILAQLAATNAESFGKREDEYYQMLDARCGELLVERMQAAAALSANLISGAWEQAGRPVIVMAAKNPAAKPEPAIAARDHAAEVKTAPKATGPADGAANDGLVGSDKSAVYHHPGCEHAKKISASNLVHYASTQEAEAQGKRACRVCKPK